MDPFLSSDVSERQLAKDFNRDRLVVNGKRIVGSLFSLSQIIDTCIAAINSVADHLLHRQASRFILP